MLYDVCKMLTCDDDDGRKVMTVAHMVLVNISPKKINSFDREEEIQI